MGKTILVADDSQTIQKAVDLTFQTTEFRVVGVADGQQALSQVGQVQPDVVLADVSMAGMGGYDLCAAIKSNDSTRNIPVVLLASAFDPFDSNRAEAAQANGHIQKPFDTQSLIALINDVTGSVGASNEPLSFAARLRKRQEAEEAASAPITSTPVLAAPLSTPPPSSPAFSSPAPFSPPAPPAFSSAPPMAPRLEPRPPPPVYDLAPPAPASPFSAPRAEIEPVSDDIMIDDPDEVIEEIEVIDENEELPTGPTLEPPTPPAGYTGPRANVDVWALADGNGPDAVDEIPIDEVPIEAPVAAPAAVQALANRAAPAIADAASVAVPGLPREELLRVAREVIEQIAWEVVPDLAETIIRAELDRLVREEL